MIYSKNETHDPTARSWVESANHPGSDFPIQNLPFGVFCHSHHEMPHIGVAIGDRIVDLYLLRDCGFLPGLDEAVAEACSDSSLNTLMALGAQRLSALRKELFHALKDDAPDELRERVSTALVLQSDVAMLLPATIGDYTDFYASIYHATNVGSMFRPDNPLLPNYKWVPIGYHGRASSICVSDTSVRRPKGQIKADGADAPEFGPAKRLDYELEVGVFVGEGSEIGSTIDIANAERHMFGVCLVNDWSARDIQTWEYQPLGPFLAKNFATSISPWIVTMEALAPYRVAAFTRAEGDPKPLPYLDSEEARTAGGIDLTLEVLLQSQRMRELEIAPQRVSLGSFRDMYWTLGQMLTHHASNGCNLRPGDLLASGTVSGQQKTSRGCLLELSWKGTEPLKLASGEERRFLEDGDLVVIRGWCERQGAARIGFGECRGTVLPAS